MSVKLVPFESLCAVSYSPYENLYSPHNSDSSSDKIDTKYTTKIIKINLIRT